MDSGYRTPLLELFRRGEVEKDVRLVGAQGALALHAHEQLALLMILVDDPDPEVASRANATIAALPESALSPFLARPEVSDVMRAFFAERGVRVTAPLTEATDGENPIEPLLDRREDETDDGAEAETPTALLASLPVIDRLKLATKGTREQRAQLIRDPNKMVAIAVLSSPKVSETEIEAFAKMANVSEDVLRVIGANRTWMKHYGITLGLTRNPKTPPGMSMQLLHRLTDRDVKTVATDRNVPEALRLAARRMTARTQR
jgi:hypothetical protein